MPSVPHTPYELEKALMKIVPIKAGEFLFAEWKNLTDDVLITSGRVAFFNSETSSRKMEQVLRNVIFQEHTLNVVFHLTKTFEQLKEQRATGEAVQPFTDVVVTVINPDAKEQSVEWDLQAAAKSKDNWRGNEYFKPKVILSRLFTTLPEQNEPDLPFQSENPVEISSDDRREIAAGSGRL